MRNYLLGSAIALLLATDISIAQTYRSEISLDYLRRDREALPDSESDTWRVSGTYYFSPVNTANHPLAEAAFLEKASNLSVSYLHEEWDYSDTYGSFRYETFVTEENLNADIELFIPNKMFYVAAGMTRDESKYRTTVFYMEDDLNPGVETDTETDSDNSWHGSLGVTPIDGLLIWSDFYEDVDLDEHWNLNAKYVTDWNGNAINIEGGYNDYDGDYSIYVVSDYYLDRTFSVGAGVSYIDAADSDNSYILRTRKFFTDRFSIHANYISSDFIDTYNIGIDVRF
ncbi:putative porin [Cellvibrio sp. PSBB006]|uniref:putative porin n=1 Tax=Cellvibrio sp. PSBB006 TaxID=1987723 RepID=UPI000B3B4656|nr:putative porin [Cellvibrio sp. PSBB006]ARU28911.1 hypothetical protein CBR65_16500 [Cellvibrio sp. PSBB006]